MSNPYDTSPQDPRPAEAPTYAPSPYAQAPGGQPPYAMPAPYGPYGPYGQNGVVLPEHPQGTTVLILGILGFVVGVTGPIAWYLGSKAQKEMRATGARYSNENTLNIGKILGIVTTALLALYALFIIVMIVIYVGLIGAMVAST